MTHIPIEQLPIQNTAEPPRILLPQPASVFADRGRRFAQLVEGHSLGGWLGFMGALSGAQHRVLADFPTVPLPSAGEMALSRTHGMPPLPAQGWVRDEAWRAGLDLILDVLSPVVPEAGQGAITSLRNASVEQLESWADRVLRTELYGEDAAVLPYVAAALQVYWTAMAARLGPGAIQPLETEGVCPCCGFLPVASHVRIGGEVANLRYLHCALCNTQWNMVRVKCTACGANDKVHYHQIEGSKGVVRAESCDACKSYLKIVHSDKDPGADPVADDLASLTLDMLMDEAGYGRSGPNLLLVPGE